MKQAKAVFPIFFLFIVLTLLVLFFFQNPLIKPLQAMTVPVQTWIFTTVSPDPQQNLSQEEQLQQENNELRSQLVKMQELEKENQALRDQFEVSDQAPHNLVPGTVIGTRKDAVVIDKGSNDGIQMGDVVLIKDNVVGKVTKTSPRLSVVTLITHPSTSFTANIIETETMGVVKAENGTIIFDNVVQADDLAENDIVVTKGDVNDKGVGYPPNLIVGTVKSVNKIDSDLFKSAKVESMVDFQKLQTVFVMIHER